MAKKNVNELLKQEKVEVANKYLQVVTHRDGYTRTHEGQYSYKVVDKSGELFIFPVQTDGYGKLQVMVDSPIAYTNGNNIHFVVNTLTDPYTQAFIRTEEIKGLDKGKQLIQAFLAFIEDRFRFGVYNVFVVGKEDAKTVADVAGTDAVKVEEVKGRAFEDLVVNYPTGNAREDVRHADQSEGMGDTSEPSAPESPTNVQVSPGETSADISAQ
ncbi:virion component [Staphylococcus phage Twort]|uniref:ORF056 n=2 Tax=Staphylococcus phage Twort (strain DSM 17442 / HER 48) TaxID=2908167 RepID=Q4Z988_BPTWO|nr:Ig domain containing protein [Staphylococcus phage Twort]AAX92351.1 ORF056 [Staphylococcus phage Twort]QIW89154.1 virion component [Staphylococcus phage Twort]